MQFHASNISFRSRKVSPLQLMQASILDPRQESETASLIRMAQRLINNGEASPDLHTPATHRCFCSVLKGAMRVFRSIFWLVPNLHPRRFFTHLQQPVTPEHYSSARVFPAEYIMPSADLDCGAGHLTFPSPTDLLSMDAVELQSCLKQGKLTSVRLVKAALDQIRKEDHNGLNLNSMISIAPEDDLLKIAAELDRERAEGNIRSPLHGITIIVKVRRPNLYIFTQWLCVDLHRTPSRHILI